jgi:hypothetical protein
MTIYARALLSGAGAGGVPIAVAATSIGSGTTIHTAVASTSTQFDEVYLWANNIDTVDHLLTLAIGGSGAGNEVCNQVNIPANSPPIPILTGLSLQDSLAVTAAADVANKINITGHINTIR